MKDEGKFWLISEADMRQLRTIHLISYDITTSRQVGEIVKRAVEATLDYVKNDGNGAVGVYVAAVEENLDER
jgi:hypothetical protein